MKTLVGFALGALLSLGAVTSASAAAPNGVAPARIPDAGIEVIVVTAKRPAPERIDEFIVTGKRPAKAVNRTPPAMAVEIQKLEFAFAAPPVVRL